MDDIIALRKKESLSTTEFVKLIAHDIELKNFCSFFIFKDKEDTPFYKIYYGRQKYSISNSDFCEKLYKSDCSNSYPQVFINKVSTKLQEDISANQIKLTTEDNDIFLSFFNKSIVAYLIREENDNDNSTQHDPIIFIIDAEKCELVEINHHNDIRLLTTDNSLSVKPESSTLISEYLNKVFYNQALSKENNTDSETNIYYRGQLLKYSLLPSLFRYPKYMENEAELNADIVNSRPEDFENCPSTFDKLVKLKHYEQPSRLMDITSNPLIALYFACESADEKDDYGVVYEAYCKKEYEKYSTLSDKVTLLSALTKATHRKGIVQVYSETPECTTLSSYVDKFCCDRHKCMHCLRSDKDIFKKCGDFLGEIGYQAQREVGLDKYWDDLSYDKLDIAIVVKPPLNNIRITHQQGLFIMCGLNPKDFKWPTDDYYKFFRLDDELIEKTKRKQRIYYISKAVAREILKELNVLGINKYYIYSELDKNIKVLLNQNS